MYFHFATTYSVERASGLHFQRELRIEIIVQKIYKELDKNNYPDKTIIPVIDLSKSLKVENDILVIAIENS